jgi:hypothetical protein
VTGPDADLAYHLRELRADLGVARAALDELGSETRSPRERIRAWIAVESALEHDLDVHLPAALKLLGVRQLARTGADRETDGGAIDLAVARAETRRCVDRALAALGDRGSADAAGIATTRDAVAAGLDVARRARAASIRLTEESSAPHSEF